MRLIRYVTALLLAFGPAAQADEFVFGLGATEFNTVMAPRDLKVTIEYHADPFLEWRSGGLGVGGAIIGHSRGDLWGGIGLVAQGRFADRWFWEASFMPGLYAEGSQETELGSTIEFRSLVAIGREISARSAISLALDHRSNASIADFNPGVDAISLRFHRRY